MRCENTGSSCKSILQLIFCILHVKGSEKLLFKFKLQEEFISNQNSLKSVIMERRRSWYIVRTTSLFQAICSQEKREAETPQSAHSQIAWKRIKEKLSLEIINAIALTLNELHFYSFPFALLIWRIELAVACRIPRFYKSHNMIDCVIHSNYHRQCSNLDPSNIARKLSTSFSLVWFSVYTALL